MTKKKTKDGFSGYSGDKKIEQERMKKTLDKLLERDLPQGNKPTDDPEKYGLKFDGEKARWDLVPMKQLMELIEHHKSVVLIPDSFNEIELFNDTMSFMSFYKIGSGKELLKHSGFNIFRLLKGRGYTEEEINRSTSDYRWDLYDIKDISGIVDVYSYGAKLYADNNWQKVKPDRYYSAFFRHFKTVITKERFDSESGMLHLYHALWNIIALMWFEENK